MDKTLLIADDDPELIEVCQDYLTRCGFRVLTASGGVECLSIIRDESPAVVVVSVDLLWGGADGLVDYLRDESRRRTVPYVILTGCTTEGNVAALYNQPCAFRYLRKPFVMRRLLDCVRTIEPGYLPGSRLASPSAVQRVRELGTI